MRMRLGRGFLRLWIVGSIAWAGLVLVAARPDLVATHLSWSALLAPAGHAGKAELERPGAAPGAANMQLAVARPDAFAAAIQEANRRVVVKTVAWLAWAAALPILLVLIAGLAAAWVARGFVDARPRRVPPILRPIPPPFPPPGAAGPGPRA
jgi:hypothetical protein